MSPTTAPSPTPAAGGYTPTAKVLHWLVALAVIGIIALGLSFDFAPDGSRTQDLMFLVHKSTGIVVLILMIVRLGWRLLNPPPPPEPDMPRLMRTVAAINQYALYALLFALPVIGWAGSDAYGAPVSLYGVIPLPSLLAKNEDLSKQIFAVHETLGLTAAGLIGLHILGALYHRFVRRDAVLARMT